MGTDAYRLEELLEDVQGFLKMLGPAKAHLVGTDFGAQLAWFAAAQMPQLISTLSILSRPHPLAHVDAIANDPEQTLRSSHHRSLLESDAAEQWRKDDLAEPRRRFSSGQVPSETAEGYLSVIRPAGALEAAIEWYVASAQRPMLQDFPPLLMPVLYVCGTEDHAVGRYARERTAHYAPRDFRYVEVHKGTHYLSDMRSDLVNELLLQHITAHADRGHVTRAWH
jgi:pimeloyl-ACP methyl ester carboxylesterase